MTMRLLAVLALLLVSAATWLDGRAPHPVPADADPGVFSADRAMRTVDDLVDGPRPGGSPAAVDARDAIAARLTAAGLTTRLHSSTGVGGADGRMAAAPVDNVVATLPGTDPTGAVVLSAHYDSVASGPGAADDMASVAAILEAVRALREGPPLRNDLVVLVTDAEEVGLLGMQAWVRDELVPAARPAVTVNFEARGVSGPSLMFRTSPGNAGLARVFADAVPHPTGDSSLVEAFRLLPNDTDLTRVLDAGRPGVDVAFVEQPVQYHTTGDAPENLSPASVQGHGEAALGLARALGNQDLAPLDPAASGAAPQGDATYFRFAGTTVVYPSWLVWPVAALGAVAVVAAVLVARRRGATTVPRVLGAAALLVVAVVAAVSASVGLWRALLAVHPVWADTGPFLHRPVPVQAAAVALAVAVTALWWLAVRRWAGAAGAAAAGVLVLAVLGLVTAGTVPGASYLFAWPAAAAGAGLTVALVLRGRPVVATAAATLGAVPAAALLVPLGWDLFVLSGVSDGVPAGALVLTAAALTVVLVSEGMQRATVGGPPGRVWPVPVAAALAAVVLAGVGAAVNGPSAERPQASHLSFLQDDEGARWVSNQTVPAAWTARYLDTPAQEVPAWPGPDEVRTGPAQPLAVPGPRVEVLSRTADRAVLRVTSPRGAPGITLRPDRAVTTATVTPAGRPAVSAAPADGLTEIRLHAVPAAGAVVELVTGPGPLGVAVADLSPGPAGVPGFVPRPPELRAAPDRTGDQVVLATRVELSG
ncbi:aminopeptidase [Pseudonocardia sp. TMWB2A]